MRYWIALVAVAVTFTMALPLADAEQILTPVIDGQWWQVAGDPDLGQYTREEQQPVGFGVWQAADGTWQLWSCIRGTGCGGATRLFYRWEGQRLTDENWRPMGIAMEAKPELGETPGGLQAPHVVRYQGLYHMAYGDWVNICFATSKDGKTFQRVIQPNGKTGVVESPVFTLASERYVLLVSGGNDPNKLYVALVEAETGNELARVTGDGTNSMRKAVVDCAGSKGKNAVVRIVDEATHGWGHINFGGIYEDPLKPYSE